MFSINLSTAYDGPSIMKIVETAPMSDPHRLDFVVETMRQLSRQTDAEAMIGTYRRRISQLMPTDRLVTLSRRNMPEPWFRITRSSGWKHAINPWKDVALQPRFDRGLLCELIYGDQPRIIDDIRLSPDDPTAEYFEGQRSLMAIPLYDDGVGLNMVVTMRREPGGFDRAKLPQQVWMSNLFGKVTQNLVLTADLREAYDVVDREMKAVAEIQRSLLPTRLPRIPGLSLAASYQTSRRAGGDYYDLFDLPDGQWGILMADVSGHGTPAAVLMAITHSIAPLVCDPPAPPAKLMAAINKRLSTLYTTDTGQFVTAAYGVYDPSTRRITYASAGHPPPRIRRASGAIESLDGARSLPLGIMRDEPYHECTAQLHPDDALVFYTDGITEARSPSGDLFDMSRLDATLARAEGDPDRIVARILESVDHFAAGRPADDDRTLLVARVKPEL
jgi:sigma-B regulation protein RsbU (phosphoserine phosphatase)